MDAQGPEWVHEGPRATFSFVKDVIRTSGAGNEPNWLRTAAEYENVRLTFEYKLAQWAEAAVILRAPRIGRPMQAGVAIYLAHDFHENITPYVTGAVAGVLPPAKRLPTSYEQWHSVQIELKGSKLRAVIDEQVVQDVDLDGNDELRYRLKRGFIGFPDLGHAYSVRKVQIQDLGSERRFVELSGGSLDG